MTIEQAKLRKRLLEDLKYKETQVDDTVEKLLNLEDKILRSFEQWFQADLFTDTPVYYGVNPKILSVTYPKMKPPAIFLLLDWIRREPKQAFTALSHEYGKLPEAKT
ncbi:MAG: hypothetical protein NTW69_00920 [Chloroflexi bacterium]|nr:hypothetical protein [Chloroflexota bacterium]